MKPLVLVSAVLVIGLVGVIGVALTAPPPQAAKAPLPLTDSARIDSFRVALEIRSRKDANDSTLRCISLPPQSGDLDHDGTADLAVQFDCINHNMHDSDQGHGYTEVAIFTGMPPFRQVMGRLQRNEQDPDLGLLILTGIKDGLLELDMYRYAPGDKRCCPSRRTHERYAVTGRRFVPITP